MVKTYFYPNLGFRIYRQHSALIPSVAYLYLENGKVPVYSANPWIESFAHTVHDVISQQRSIYYTYDLELQSIFFYNLHSSRLAQRITAEN